MLDLSKLSIAVEGAVLDVLRLPSAPGGAEMGTGSLLDFNRDVRRCFNDLNKTNERDALEFAATVSALFHECKHIHDLRSTRIGCELLLHDLQAYSGIQLVLDALSAWCAEDRRNKVAMPITSDRLHELGLGAVEIGILERALAKRKMVDRWWRTTSSYRTLPGHSIKDLFETVGFCVQFDWLEVALGAGSTRRVMEAAFGTESIPHAYVRPMMAWNAVCRAIGGSFNPQSYDLSRIVIDALNVNGIDAAFAENSATTKHPGAWFDRFVERYARLGTSDCPPEQRAWHGTYVEIEKETNDGMGARLGEADAAITALQEDVYKALSTLARESVGKSNLRGAEAILIATEVGVDFRQMLPFVSGVEGDYHDPAGYVDLLLRGELPSVYVSLKTSIAERADFRTPSAIPTNHIGGSRVASEAAQRMRILLCGRGLVNAGFFEDEIFREMTSPIADGGLGLAFSRSWP
jgi:hypothetical protein